MRNISFALTTEQINNQTKTVTRRLGWKFLKFGDLIQPVEKSMGLKKGEKIKKIGPPIKVINVRREELHHITDIDIKREGFEDMSFIQFLEMFCNHMNVSPSTVITRIEFEFTKS